MLQSHYGKQAGTNKIIATMCSDPVIIASETGARSATARLQLQSAVTLVCQGGNKTGSSRQHAVRVIVWQITVRHWQKS